MQGGSADGAASRVQPYASGGNGIKPKGKLVSGVAVDDRSIRLSVKSLSSKGNGFWNSVRPGSWVRGGFSMSWNACTIALWDWQPSKRFCSDTMWLHSSARGVNHVIGATNVPFRGIAFKWIPARLAKGSINILP